MSLGLVSYGSSDGEASDDDVPDRSLVEGAASLIKDDDDEFGFDEEYQTNASSTLKLPAPRVNNSATAVTSGEKVDGLTTEGHQLKFSVIPQPSDIRNTLEIEAEPEMIISAPAAEVALREKPPPKRKTVKIAALAFTTVDSDSDDEGIPITKISKTTISDSKEKKTGLFAVLPPPKTSSQLFVPKSVAAGKPTPKMPQQQVPRKPQPNSSGVNLVSKSIDRPSTSTITKSTATKSRTVAARSTLNKGNSSDDDDNDNGPINFFSIGEDKIIPANVDFSTNSALNDTPIIQSNSQMESESLTNFVTNDENIGWGASEAPGEEYNYISGADEMKGGDLGVEVGEAGYSYGVATTHQSQIDDDQWSKVYGQSSNSGAEDINLQDEQFLRLQGRKNRGERINIRDIQAMDAPSVLELSKNMTRDEELMPTHNSKDLPSAQQRRKHQITYLAHQAKEREFQLKNQWAENRTNKRQAQSKYGF